ncbi:MAG: hypothetical protein Q9160_004460 [Pyrenula sp. 1 TL-2023]
MFGESTQNNVEDIENVLGAVIFTAYILAALLFTYLILRDLYFAFKAINASHRPPNRFKIGLYAAQSAISFGVLSVNMLFVLVRSYQSWSLQHDFPLPYFTSLIRGRDLHLWHWAKTSTLFQDFARDLCANVFQFWWTQGALLLSLLFSVFMAVEGKLASKALPTFLNMSSGSKRQIGNLPYYFILEQILPLSFTQNLFLVAVLLHPLNDKHAKTTLWTSSSFIMVSTSLPVFSYLLWTIQNSLEVSIPLIFVTRFLLFLPYILLCPRTQRRFLYVTPCKTAHLHHAYGSMYTSLGLGALALHGFHTASMFLDEQSRIMASSRIWSALYAAPAVTALGQDMILSLFSGSCWFFAVQPCLGV